MRQKATAMRHVSTSAIAARQQQQQKYMQASHSFPVLERNVIQSQREWVGESVSIGILCVARREAEASLFSETRKHFVEKGFNVESIRMIHGIDCRTKGAEVSPSGCVMWAFQYKFIPRALLLFAERPELKFAFFGEDDARICSDATADTLVKAACKAAPSACRLGWLATKDYGCQLTSFTHEACVEFARKFDAMTNKNKPYAHLYSLDLWWKKIRRCQMPSGHALMKDADKNFVSQKPHLLRGRR